MQRILELLMRRLELDHVIVILNSDEALHFLTQSEGYPACLSLTQGAHCGMIL